MVNTRTTLPAASNTGSIKVTRRVAALGFTTKGKEREASNTAIAYTSKGKGREPSNTESHSISNLIRVKIEPEMEMHVLTVEVQGKPILDANMDKDHGEVGSQLFLHLMRTNF
jgi:hypothetical protein